MHQPSPIVSSQSRLQTQQQQNGGRIDSSASQSEAPAILTLLPLTGTFDRKQISVPYFPEVLRIGRQTNAKTVPTPTNGYFDSKVLSRQHAEVWADKNGKVWIRDVKSSNGTFVNGVRLSPENRDSEPHELREHDTLELGIDIVSEDQKSIVHHKVSAKVEHAGVYGSGANVLDINFGDIDPNSGGQLVGQQINHGVPQLRGRGSSQSSIGSGGRATGLSSIVGSHQGGLAQQRQMNFWMNPITIEQVVKKLTTELKQAKQQSQDLHRTGDFFSTLLTLEPGEEMPKAPEQDQPMQPKANGVSPILSSMEAVSPYSQPPAPPPQQPLPEKPDVARFTVPDLMSQPSLKRSETEKPKIDLDMPTKPEASSSQILSLVEALTTAKKEIDSQGDRVMQLEILLKRERKARESAEERTRRLLAGESVESVQEIAANGNNAVETSTTDDAFPDLALDSSKDGNLRETDQLSLVSDSNEDAQEPVVAAEDFDVATTQLQEKYDAMVQEMNEMKVLMENYKRRAEHAEEERRSLAEMIEQIRARDTISPIPGSRNGENTDPFKGAEEATASSSAIQKSTPQASGLWNGTSISSSLQHRKVPNGSIANPLHRATTSEMQALERTMSTALQQDHKWVAQGGGDVMVQSAPYVSIVGVVLIGVGLMTWLNGWQKIER
ncbi:MAG: hypothetical protein Q9167_006033 [Letrouitia subvulpina]